LFGIAEVENKYARRPAAVRLYSTEVVKFQYLEVVIIQQLFHLKPVPFTVEAELNSAWCAFDLNFKGLPKVYAE